MTGKEKISAPGLRGGIERLLKGRSVIGLAVAFCAEIARGICLRCAQHDSLREQGEQHAEINFGESRWRIMIHVRHCKARAPMRA